MIAGPFKMTWEKQILLALSVLLILLTFSPNSLNASDRLDLTQENGQYFVHSSVLNGTYDVSVNDSVFTGNFQDQAVRIPDAFMHDKLVFIRINEENLQRLFFVKEKHDEAATIRSIPLWLSIIPPLVAIGFALIFKEVLVSLFLGIFSGSFIAGGLSFANIIPAFLAVIDEYIIPALSDSGHMSVIVFSLLIGGMVAIISKNGGMAGVVERLSKFARTARSSQFVTWLLGVAIFFDDYANTLIVGNTMRSVTDKFRVSREKLAYIVDSTAAPVAAVAFITTWIGAELGYIDDGVGKLVDYPFASTPYAIFISSLKYSFYPVLTLIFILIIIYTGRDYGPMLKAERRARTTGQVSPAATPEADEPNMEDLSPVRGAIPRSRNAIVPVLVVIIGTIIGLLVTGMSSTYEELIAAGVDPGSNQWGSIWRTMPAVLSENAGFVRKLGKIIGNSDSYVALLWSSMSGVIVAILMSIWSRIMTLFNAVHYMTIGFKTMMPAVLILTLAWSLAITTDQLHTADFLTNVLQDNINPRFLPMLFFVLSALIAFSTGSSWSTMAILYPIAIPTTWAVAVSNGLPAEVSYEILLNSISVVLAASVLGDHCSPISDTTILSSLASDCNHIDHVRTQLPYALTVGTISLIACGLSTILGGGWLICTLLLALGIIILWFIVRRVGKTINA